MFFFIKLYLFTRKFVVGDHHFSPFTPPFSGTSASPRTRHEDVTTIAACRGPQGHLRELDLQPPFRQPRHLRVYMDTGSRGRHGTSWDLGLRSSKHIHTLKDLKAWWRNWSVL